MDDTRAAVDRPATIVAAGMITAAGALFFNLMPFLVGAAEEAFPWNETQLGIFAGAGLAGATLVTLTAPFWIRRWPWRRTMRLASIAGAMGWGLASQLDSFVAIASCVSIVGVLVGIFYAPAIACIGDSLDPDRGFGIMIVAQVSLAAACSAIIPSIVERSGIQGLFLLLAATCILPTVLASWLPDQGRTREVDAAVDGVRDTQSSNTFGVMLGLAALMVFYVGVVGVWGFLELIGNASQISDSEVAYAIATALLMGAGGAMVAASLSKRISQPVAISLGSVALVLFLVAMGVADGYAFYLIAIVGMNVAWNFGLAYQIGLIAALDVSGRYTVLVTAALGIGGVLGPVLAGVLVTEDGYAGVIGMGIIGTLVSLGLFLVAARLRPEQNSSST